MFSGERLRQGEENLLLFYHILSEDLPLQEKEIDLSP